MQVVYSGGSSTPSPSPRLQRKAYNPGGYGRPVMPGYLTGHQHQVVVPRSRSREKLTEGDTSLRDSIPAMSKPVAITCLVLNVLLPGLEVDIGGSCAAPNAANCKTGTACDTGDICRIKQGTSCSNNMYDCVSGATCTSNTCTCNTDITTADAGTGKCTPKANVLGGACTSGSCTDTNAQCSNSICACTGAFVPRPEDLKCAIAAGASCASNSNLCTTGTVCMADKCKKMVGQACTGTGDAANCVSNADCTSGTCSCKTGYSASGGKCSSASGVLASGLVLVLAFVTSRLL